VSLARALPLAAAFAALAAVVGAGLCTGIDQWAVDHMMPGGSFGTSEPTLLEALVPLYGAQWDDPLSIAADLVTLPAAFLLSLLIVTLRSRPLGVALLVAVAIEVLCKEVVVRPPLHDGALHIVPFDSSFPSGHSLRTVLLAAALRPVLGLWVVAWAVASLALLLLAGWHTPTDIAGGVLLGAVAVLCVGARPHSRPRSPR